MGKKAAPIEEIKQRIYATWGDVVTIREETYIDTNKSCKFIDKDYGEFQTSVKHVCACHGHRIRGYQKLSKIMTLLKTKKIFGIEYPELLKEWDYNKNTHVDPFNVAPKSGKKVWWKCSNGHEWFVQIGERVDSKRGCAKCWKYVPAECDSLGNTSFTSCWDYNKNTTSPFSVSRGTHDAYNWKCPDCQHEWITSPNHITRPNGSGCPKCSTKTNKFEIFAGELFNVPKNVKLVLQNRKFPPDFIINDKTFINIHGLWYHGVKINSDKWRHMDMRQAFESEGYRILQFYYNEIYDQPSIVQSIVNNAAGNIQDKIFARKCELLPVPTQDMKIFFEKTHLMGVGNLTKAIGLYFNNELVSCMSYKKCSKHVEIHRFSSKLNTIIIGGFQRLLSRLEEIAKINNKNMIVSFCDLRYATGISYEKAGFKRKGVTLGFSWTDGRYIYNRRACKAAKIIIGDYIVKVPEPDMAIQNRIYKIYDAGQAKYFKILGEL